MFQKVLAGDFQFNDDVANVSISKEAKDLITKLLNPDPCSRYSMKEAQDHPWLSDTDQSSYLVNYSKFLSSNKINLKPKHLKDLDQDLVTQLASASDSFRIEDQSLSYGQLIAKYFKSCHRKSSSLNKKLGRDAFAVQNLCVAYKFLLQRKLIDASGKNEVLLQKRILEDAQQEAKTFCADVTEIVTQK